MIRSRLLLVVCVVLAAGIAVDSGAFSSVESDQGVSVETVGDESAFMKLSEPDNQPVSVNDNEQVELVRITNQFTESVTFTISDVAADNGVSATTDESPSPSQSPSDTEPWTVMVTLSCDSSETAEITTEVSYHVTADGDSVFVETTDTRTVEYTINCEQTTETGTTSS